MKVAIVTGASKGLGLALAKELAGQGWSLVIDARGEDELTRSADQISRASAQGTEVVAIPGDVTDPEHRKDLVEAARSLGGLDLLVNNASELGPSPLPRLLDYPLDALRVVLEVDTIAPLALIQQAAGLLNESTDGRILNITSDASAEHYEGWGGYGLAKTALDHLTGTLAAENPNLRAWSVDPGDLRTDMHQRAFPGEDISDRPLPESSVPHLLALVNSELASGRYKAGEIAILKEVSR